jgi:hypothetical protein
VSWAYFILDGDGKTVRVASTRQWAALLERSGVQCSIAETLISRDPYVCVKTSFIGIDYDFTGFGAPQVFATSILYDTIGAQTSRYATRDEAITGHLREVELARAEHAERSTVFCGCAEGLGIVCIDVDIDDNGQSQMGIIECQCCRATCVLDKHTLLFFDIVLCAGQGAEATVAQARAKAVRDAVDAP